jgi:hypothetical protein
MCSAPRGTPTTTRCSWPLLDREVPYALFVLVDIDGRAVLKRWAIPIPEANEVVLDLDAIPTQRVAFDPTGQRAAFAGFGHIWVLDRATDTVRDLGKVGKVSALAWSPAHGAFVWSTPTGALGGLPRDQAPAFTLPPAVGLHLGTDGNTLATVFGQLLTWRAGDAAPIAVPALPRQRHRRRPSARRRLAGRLRPRRPAVVDDRLAAR